MILSVNIKDYSLTVENNRFVLENFRLKNIKNSIKNIIPLAIKFVKDMTVYTAFCLTHGYIPNADWFSRRRMRNKPAEPINI